MTEPLVSIIIPSYNRADLIGETIDSVLRQDYPNLEIIVLDDGSTDNTVAVLEGYGQQIQWMCHPNMGETGTVNRGFSLAKGEVISVLSSDDLFLPGAVRAAVEVLQRDAEAVATYCDYVVIDGVGSVIQYWKCFEYDLVEVLRDCECPPGPGAFFRREVLDKVGGRDPNIRTVADFEFWLRVALHGRVQRIPSFGSAYREHGDSTSVGGLSVLLGQELIGAVEKFYGQPDLPEPVLAIRRQAIGAAYFVAGCRCGNNFRFKLSCFARAFPYISNYRRGRAILELLQGFAWGRAIKRALIHRIRQAEGIGLHYSELQPVSGRP